MWNSGLFRNSCKGFFIFYDELEADCVTYDQRWVASSINISRFLVLKILVAANKCLQTLASTTITGIWLAEGDSFRTVDMVVMWEFSLLTSFCLGLDTSGAVDESYGVGRLDSLQKFLSMNSF